ncbi:MAG: polymer-forming cytoskeletal protein [Holophagales bacterium]|nr:polymer-forming cytoskeletal protein [Holophagales bacterium]
MSLSSLPRAGSGRGIPGALIVASALLCLPSAARAASSPAAAGAATAEPAAYHLSAGSVARSRIVALGRDLIVDGKALSHCVTISGSALISGQVEGDVIVLGGAAVLAETATVEGDVYVLGGHVDMAPGASIGGRSVAYPEASDLWVALVGGPSMGLPATSKVVLGAKLALLAFWCFVMLLVLAVARRELVATSESIQKEPFHNFFLGITGVAAMVLTALFFSAFSGAFLGVPLLVLVAVVALLLRFWGMVAVFHALGSWLHRKLGRRLPVAVTTATWGLVVLGIAKMVPYLGIWLWSLATFIGVGAALGTKLGRKEAWFEA